MNERRDFTKLLFEQLPRQLKPVLSMRVVADPFLIRVQVTCCDIRSERMYHTQFSGEVLPDEFKALLATVI